MKIIARIHTDFSTKFGIPRQSGIVEELKGKIIFEPEYRNVDAVRGIEQFSHIWLIWQFSQALREEFTPLVRPPRLGGNTYMGVFATRSPYRPNSLGLSCVRLEKIEYNEELGAVLHVSGADLLDGTPIFDIKPYLPYTDSRPDASNGFAPTSEECSLDVNFPENLLKIIPKDKRTAVIEVLRLDPRPQYHDDSERVYGMNFSGFDIRFTVVGKQLTVCEVLSLAKED
ncbi:MAG: tRNA (N6-threonylcarbamoyladenosine(37)-N6)-methyltransferase TrmO [Clostridia bacterium]|nr:tRNA (N6-threonylcarbamoyladenosine(37)-N6)-methyltransferase TrmO [Clostridia bacterium]